MDPEIESVSRDLHEDLTAEPNPTNAAEPRPASKRAFGLTLIGFWVFGAGSMWAWIIFEAIHWISRSEAVLLQSPLAQEPFW
jgi:hypothetical protein